MSDAATPSTDPARRDRRALLVALGVDNLGSGLFLPLAVVYTTTVVGVPLATAGLLLTAGTLVGLLAPPLAGRVVDRLGPRTVVVASQVLQVLGTVVYLVATGPVAVLLAAALVAAGTQTFYSAVFALIADVAPPGPKDRTFAAVEMVRSAAFGVGALVATALVSAVDVSVLRTVLVLDAVSFVVAAVLLVVSVRVRHRPAATPGASAPDAHDGTAPLAPSGSGPGGPHPEGPLPVLRNRPYLGLIAITALLGLPVDFLLVGLAVYLREVDQGAVWAAGAAVAVLTAAIATLSGAVVRRTAAWRRTTAMAVGGWCAVGWAASSMSAIRLPDGWVGPWVLGSTVLLAVGGLISGPRANALAEAAAPPASRGRHLAAFQYSYTAAGLLAPLLVSTLAVGLWVPWALVGGAALLGAVAVPVVGRRLPVEAVRPTTRPPARPPAPGTGDGVPDPPPLR